MTREMIRRPVTVDPAGLRRRMVDAVIGEEVLRRWRVAFTPWRASLLTVPRHRFLPATVWVDNDADPPPALVPLHREQDPDRWLELAYAADHRSGAAHRQVTGYHVRMTAAAASGPQPGAGSPPFADASPAQVRAALIPEDVAEFDRQWRTVMAKATETLDLVDVLRTLESWRRVAWLTTASGPEGYRKMLARAEHSLRTGELPPGTVPLDQVKALIAQRLG